MTRAFPLAGLLRLRHIQQDQAAGELAAANARMHENSTLHKRARAALGGTPSAATSTAALYAVAAARASSRSMLADLNALAGTYQMTINQAQEAFNAARAGSIGLEKLEGRHARAVAAEELRAEQSVIDEVASIAWHRDREGVVR